MARIPRKNQKIFCGNDNGSNLAVFGTMKTNNPVYSTNIETLQSAIYEDGWQDAILNDKAPYLEEMNGVQYGLSTQIAYLLQQGLACEWNKDTTYYKGSTVAVINNTDVTYYKSVADDNTNHNPVSDDGTYWVLDSVSKIEQYNTALTNAYNTLNSSVVKLTGNQTVNGTKTFTSPVYVPASAATGTALSLAARGTVSGVNNNNNSWWLKLGDGTLIQWGSAQMDSGRKTMLVSMPAAYSSASSYRVFLTDRGGDTSDIASQKCFEYTSSSSFKVRSDYNQDFFNWFAIGR